MRNRQQRENLARYKALVAMKDGNKSITFILSTLQKVPLTHYPDTIEETGVCLLERIKFAFGDKLPEPLFFEIALTSFSNTALNIAESSGSMAEVRKLIGCLDAFLKANNASVLASHFFDFHEAEQLCAYAESKHLHNLHLTKKVQERKVML